MTGAAEDLPGDDVFGGEEAPIREVELLFFDVGGQRYGADASQVLRIDRARPNAHTWAPLGTLQSGNRALVYREGESSELQLRVDQVHGVRPVPLESLRRMPEPARRDPSLVGVWLDGEPPVLLIDLRLTVAAARAAVPASPDSPPSAS